MVWFSIYSFIRDGGFESCAYAATPDRKLHTFKEKGAFANQQKNLTIGLIKKLREAKAYERNDYKEVLELTEAYLNENDSYKFLKPGAVHKARWMSKQAYCFKMVMLQASLN